MTAQFVSHLGNVIIADEDVKEFYQIAVQFNRQKVLDQEFDVIHSQMTEETRGEYWDHWCNLHNLSYYDIVDVPINRELIEFFTDREAYCQRINHKG